MRTHFVSWWLSGLLLALAALALGLACVAAPSGQQAIYLVALLVGDLALWWLGRRLGTALAGKRAARRASIPRQATAERSPWWGFLPLGAVVAGIFVAVVVRSEPMPLAVFSALFALSAGTVQPLTQFKNGHGR